MEASVMRPQRQHRSSCGGRTRVGRLYGYMRVKHRSHAGCVHVFLAIIFLLIFFRRAGWEEKLECEQLPIRTVFQCSCGETQKHDWTEDGEDDPDFHGEGEQRVR